MRPGSDTRAWTVRPVSRQAGESRGDVVAKKTHGKLVVRGFDYSLAGDNAERARACAEKIHRTVQRSVADLIEVGRDLLAVKEALSHGHFGAWRSASARKPK